VNAKDLRGRSESGISEEEKRREEWARHGPSVARIGLRWPFCTGNTARSIFTISPRHTPTGSGLTGCRPPAHLHPATISPLLHRRHARVPGIGGRAVRHNAAVYAHRPYSAETPLGPAGQARVAFHSRRCGLPHGGAPGNLCVIGSV